MGILTGSGDLAQHNVRGVDLDPSANDFFKEKLQRFTGPVGLAALRVIDPDRLLMPLRAKVFIPAQLSE